MLATGGFVAQSAHATDVPLSFAANRDYTVNSSPSFPTGNVNLGGVLFSIPGGGQLNTWYSAVAAGGGPGAVTLTISGINLTGVNEVDTLMNTNWGQSGPSTISVVFTYTDTSTAVFNLIGGTDVRDYFSGVYTNTINGTTTTNVFSVNNTGPAGTGEYRIDKQRFNLASLNNKTLSQIDITDTGDTAVQRVYVSGITAVVVPEPSAALLGLVGLALGGVVTLRRRRH